MSVKRKTGILLKLRNIYWEKFNNWGNIIILIIVEYQSELIFGQLEESVEEMSFPGCPHRHDMFRRYAGLEIVDSSEDKTATGRQPFEGGLAPCAFSVRCSGGGLQDTSSRHL